MMNSSRSLVDPELLSLLDAWPAMTIDETTLPLMRQPGRLPLPPIAHPERVEKRTVLAPGRNGAPDVPLVIYQPAHRDERRLACIYHMHGGGFIAGSAAGMEALHRELVHSLNCVLVTVEYRLAPETPFPGPLEDCYAGLVWTFAQADMLAVDTQRIGVMGESAGGNLAAALCMLARDRGELPIAFQHLMYPALDDRTCTRPDRHPHTGEFIWNLLSNAFAWRSYLDAEPGSEGISGYAAPARAQDLSGLPPAFIATGALDLFLDENLAYAARLLRAGVPTELHVYAGAFHGFDLAPSAQVSRRARRDSDEALKTRLAGCRD